MLNYIWISLIVIGILTAAGRDVYDESMNTYRNGIALPVELPSPAAHTGDESIDGTVSFTAALLHNHFGRSVLRQDSWESRIRIHFHSVNSGTFTIPVGDSSPAFLQAMSAAQGGKSVLAGRCTIIRNDSTKTIHAQLVFDPIHYVWLKKITSAAFDAATLAVQIAIGLIGIMALWLGVMKVAEQSGLIAKLARAVRPLTRRLFPDVPADHPAIGAMMMNIAANMLGLGNAATPFGLKAMEELNKLNPNAGQATNAMVTFLALNTSCITLIPATAIAVRAAIGSSDPAIIIAPTLLASLTATIIGVTLSKLLQRVRLFSIREEVQ